MQTERVGVSGATNVPLIEACNISKQFRGVQALDDVSFTLNEGEILALVGENGAGKSTLIKILSGAHNADSGQILMDGEHIDIANPLDAEQHGVVTVYQELNLFPSLSVAENLLFGHYPRRGPFVDWRKARQQAQHFLAGLGVHVPVERPVSSLSIADQQLLEIAKALHQKARILILDEPTAVLGGEDAEALMKIVLSLKDHGVAVIFISHRLDEIFGVADRYLVLKDGQLSGSGLISETNHDDLVAKMVGRELVEPSYRSSTRDGKREVLRVEKLSREGAFRDVSFSVGAGEVLGVAGLRGAGRTEVARAIFGLDPINEGKIFVRGAEVTIGSPNAAVAQGMGLVPEDRKTQGLLMNLSVAENVDLASVSSSGPLKLITPQRERQVAREHVRTLNIRLHDVQQSVGDLSGGNQQKVVIAKWLDAAASILILDEPTRGVDVGSKREIYEIIRKLCDDDGATVILISSELPEILEMSDRILVMHQGEVGTIMDRKDASEEAIMRYAVGGEEPHLQYSEVTAGLVEQVLGELKLEPSIYCGDKCKEALRLQADPKSIEGKVALSWNGTSHPYGAVTLEKGKQLQQKFFPKMQLQTLDGRDDATVQTSQVEDAIAGGIDVLIISPLTTDALVPVVNRAKGEGVKVIAADRTVDTDVDLYIGANSVESGRIAGRYFVERLKDGGNVVEITGTLGASATIDRHKGFTEIIEQHPDIKVIADQTGNFVRGPGLSVMQDFLQRFPSGEIDAVYCHNDEMALGAYQAVKEAGREDEMFVTGFDGSDVTFQSIKAGQMAATVVYPVMSTECLIGAAKMLAGEELPQEILLETPLVTRQNVIKWERR